MKKIIQTIFAVATLVFGFLPVAPAFAYTAPDVVTYIQTNVDQDSALLRGRVNIGDVGVVTRVFKWGTTTATTNTLNAGTGGAALFQETLSGLQANTTYYFKACGTNSVGSDCGNVFSFTTTSAGNGGTGGNGGTNGTIVAPDVVTYIQTNLTTNTATLRGRVNVGNVGSVNRFFKWGTTTATTNTLNDSVGGAGIFEQTLTGLQANTTYYYKACGANSAGTDCGTVFTFNTGGTNNNQTIPDVITNNATNIYYTSAFMNGTISGTNLGTVNRYFKYGTSSSNLNQSIYASNGGSGAFSSQVTGLANNTTYYYKACGANSAGADCGTIVSFTTYTNNNNNNNNYNTSDDIEVQTESADDVDEESAVLVGYIQELDGETVERYFEWGTDDDDLDERLSVSGTTNDEDEYFEKRLSNLDEDETYYYRACIETTDGDTTDCGSVRSFSTDDDTTSNTNGDEPDAITNVATGVGATSATINGLAIIDGVDSDVYFEWGPTTSLGNTTSDVSIDGNSVAVSRTLTGLSRGTAYFYRIVVENQEGRAYGDIRSFVTTNNTTVVSTNNTTTNTVVRTVVDNSYDGSESLFVALNIASQVEDVFEGDGVTFDVTYRNIADTDLRDAVLTVSLPEELTFRSANAGFYSEKDHALVVDLGTLEDDEDGEVMIRTIVKNVPEDRDILVTTAEITHDHPGIADAQASATANALTSVMAEDGSVLGASVFGSGVFFPGSIFGWLLLLLVILAIVWLARKMYHESKGDTASAGSKDIKDTIRLS